MLPPFACSSKRAQGVRHGAPRDGATCFQPGPDVARHHGLDILCPPVGLVVRKRSGVHMTAEHAYHSTFARSVSTCTRDLDVACGAVFLADASIGRRHQSMVLGSGPVCHIYGSLSRAHPHVCEESVILLCLCQLPGTNARPGSGSEYTYPYYVSELDVAPRHVEASPVQRYVHTCKGCRFTAAAWRVMV